MDANPTHGMENSARPQPVKRLNSKENPFLPGGDLSKETDDLLKRAVIVRDQFVLDGERRESGGQSKSPANQPDTSQMVQETHVTPVSASPVSKGKENGQSGEQVDVSKDTPASPGSPGTPQTKSEVPKEKKKGKCCSIM